MATGLSLRLQPGCIYGCRYDALIVDLYTGDNPLEMLTAEALGRLKREWLKVWVRVRVGVRGRVGVWVSLP